jgi:phenylacetic acid degradation operon negative regulatory protein
MKPKTEEFLSFLLWSAEQFLQPTFRNLTDSYESWAYRKGLLRRVATLEQQGLVERDPTTPEDRIYRLTTQGRLRALGGRDPQVRWSREWDGRWRLVLFDVPVTQNTRRARLRRYLAANGFGYLQNSVWITPDPLEAERQRLMAGKIDVESLLLLEARPCAGETDSEIVAGAWDFGRINRRYLWHASVLARRPAGDLRTEAAARALLHWAATERKAWHNAVMGDPLLPRKLLPPDYQGERVWRRRIETLRQARQQLRTFRA